MRNISVAIATALAIGGCASEPKRPVLSPIAEALAAHEDLKAQRAFAWHREAEARGPLIRAGYSKLVEGMTEPQIDQAFSNAPFTPSQIICGQSSSGPVLCRIREYRGLVEDRPFSVKITLRQRPDGTWAAIAWE